MSEINRAHFEGWAKHHQEWRLPDILRRYDSFCELEKEAKRRALSKEEKCEQLEGCET